MSSIFLVAITLVVLTGTAWVDSFIALENKAIASPTTFQRLRFPR